MKSNKDQGEGRLDVEVWDRPNRRAFIIEAKVAESREGMAACCDQALAQIADRYSAMEWPSKRRKHW